MPDKALSRATAEIAIAIPRERAWERLRDLSVPHRYVPGLTGCRMDGAQREGVGASRTVFRKQGGPMNETVTEWQEGYGFVLRLHAGDQPPAPFREAYFTYRIADDGKGGTIFSPALDYRLPGGPVIRWLDRLVLNRIANGILAKVARNLKLYYETGRPSNPDYPPDA
jgi:hypothetical protein